MTQKGRVSFAAVLLAVVVVGVIGIRWGISGAAAKDEFGLVDMQIITERYVQPTLIKELEPEMKKLQEEFDEKSKDATDEAKAELFATYQGRLNAKEQEMLERLFSEFSAAAAQVKKEQGLRLVYDKAAVVAGGTDITDQVLAKLEVK
ncbi:MAG: OmpH family outer membrane protein [Limnochordia bacterium]